MYSYIVITTGLIEENLSLFLLLPLGIFLFQEYSLQGMRDTIYTYTKAENPKKGRGKSDFLR